MGMIMGVIKGDTRSLDIGSYIQFSCVLYHFSGNSGRSL